MTLFKQQLPTDCMEAMHDHHTWKAWLEAHGPRLLLCARQWTRSLADAEDVLQEAFVRYWRHQRNLPGDPRALLITSIRRAAIDLSRRESRRSLREEKSTAGQTAGDGFFSPPALDETERCHEIELALRGLPLEQREVLVLKIWNGLTFDEIATALDIPPNTAASRYRYALGALRKELKPVCHG